MRASAVVIEDAHRAKVALIACDVLMVERDVLDRAAQRIEQAAGIPFDSILINATHTHHAPTTATIHGYTREEGFTHQLEDKIVQAAVKANGRLAPATVLVPARRRVVSREEQPAAAGGRDDLLDRLSAKTRFAPPDLSIPNCPCWRFAVRTASSRPSSSITRRTRSARIRRASVRRRSMAWRPRGLKKRRGGLSSSSRGLRARHTTLASRPRRPPTAFGQAVDRALELAQPLADRSRAWAAERNHAQGPPVQRGRR